MFKEYLFAGIIFKCNFSIVQYPKEHHMDILKEYIEDNNEFLSDEIYRGGEGAYIEDEGKSSLPRKTKERLRHLADRSSVSNKQAYQFMSWTELDMMRKDEESLNIYSLFEAFCENGSRFWLDPSPWLKKLDDIIGLYAGKGSDRKRFISPFVDLLADCAAKGINPAAFLQYILEPRLSDDRDWRRWPERHMGVLRMILDMLIELRSFPPFDREILGAEGNQMSRDVVLVKYGGKPLSLYSEADMANQDLRRSYLEAWQNLSLDNAFTIFFMKANLLHFMYLFSGKISFQHLIAILEQMPQIEEGFRDSFPQGVFNLNISAISLNLYDYDINKSVASRKAKGFKNTDFTRELRAYMKIIAALLKTGAGLYLCGFFAKKMTIIKDPETADSFAALIEVLTDNGGKRIYTWHAETLIKKPKIDHPRYIEYIRECGGCDPSYPSANEIFHDSHEAFFSYDDYRSMMNELDITIEDISASTGRAVDTLPFRNITPGMVLNTYKDKYPHNSPVIDRIIDDICSGKDRLWDDEFLIAADSLGTALHYPLLKRVVRGIQSNIFYQPKSKSFAGLYNLYKSDNSPRFHEAGTSFSISGIEREAENQDNIVRQEVRRQIDLTVYNQLWECINHEGGTFDGAIRHMNSMGMVIREAIERIESEILTSEQNMKNSDQENSKGDDKKSKKKKRSLEALKKQRDEIENFISYFENTNDRDLRFLLALIAAGSKGKTGDDFSKDIISAVVKRYSTVARISGRLEYLKQDVPIELLTLEQAGRIINTIEVIALEISGEAENIIKRHESRHDELVENLVPFITLRSKRLDSDAVDAAFKSLVSYNRLTSLVAKWIEIADKNNLIDKTREHFSIITSREPVDAYYGDMGSICLSGYPELAKHPSFINCRLVSEKEKTVTGMAVMFYSPFMLHDYGSGREGFWHAFAVNPLPSLLNRLTVKNQLAIYLHFRMIFEKVSIASGLPVVLSGISTPGIVSNTSNFADEIVSLEKKWGSIETFSASGLSVYYTEESFSHGLVIIDPDRESTIKTLSSKYESE